MRSWDKTKIIIFPLGENDDFLRIPKLVSAPGPLSEGTAPTNFFHDGAKKMDFPLVLFPQESPLYYNQFIKYQILIRRFIINKEAYTYVSASF